MPQPDDVHRDKTLAKTSTADQVDSPASEMMASIRHPEGQTDILGGGPDVPPVCRLWIIAGGEGRYETMEPHSNTAQQAPTAISMPQSATLIWRIAHGGELGERAIPAPLVGPHHGIGRPSPPPT